MKEMKTMARTKSLASLDAQITKAQEDLVKAKAKYDTVADTLEKLQSEKKELQARQIMKAFIKSGKSFRQIMNFLDTGQN
jgi:predicted  nucleic acid-binding Zn-ribbon protein